MRLLILGGTVFLGRHLVRAALDRGHTITLFNRGRHNPELFPEVERLYGDRGADLTPLRGRCWDAVVDTCGYVPRVVRESARALSASVGHYTFVSSISVYARLDRPGVDEAAPVGILADERVEEVTGESYGPLKALCEREVAEQFPEAALNIRPGLLVGPHDPTDRFTYWPVRAARGGDVLAPATRESPLQVLDARDLAEWMVRMVEAGETGTFNATAPDYTLTWGHLLDDCRLIGGSETVITWVTEEFLLEQGVEPWSELPLWVPHAEQTARCLHQVSARKAISAGLRFRPLVETARDTLAWWRALPAERELQAGITPQREAELLSRWHARSGE